MKNNFKNLSADQLREKLAELTAQQSKLQFAHGVTSLENPMQLRTLRRDIARINTYLSSGK